MRAAQQIFERLGDRSGRILAQTGLARGLWREGRYDESLQLVLPLRDEGLAVLRHEQRGLLLNTIAGCYSARNESEQAFAYMYQALRDAPPARGHGYDAVLHCNLAHELMQLGDYDEALKQSRPAWRAATSQEPAPGQRAVDQPHHLSDRTRPRRRSAARHRACRRLAHRRHGRGALTPHFETMAIAAFSAGEVALGRRLVERAREVEREPIVEEQLELALAEALLARAEGDLPRAAAQLEGAHDRAAAGDLGVSLRVRCAVHLLHSQVLEAQGDAAAALARVREWQRLSQERAQLASRAHYQAAALQTELLLLQHQLDEKDAQRRATERARAELEAANRRCRRR